MRPFVISQGWRRSLSYGGRRFSWYAIYIARLLRQNLWVRVASRDLLV